MTASPSEPVGPSLDCLHEGSRFVQLTLHLSPTDAAVVLQAAAVHCQTVTEFTLQAVLAEARRVTGDNRASATATTGRLELIDEAFDRLAAALGESEKSLHALGDLIERTQQTDLAVSESFVRIHRIK
jgi:uncharacterized protein (DUF1778 family)